MTALDAKSKVLLAAFAIAVALTVYATYDRAVVRQDFGIEESEPFEEEALDEEEAPVEEEGEETSEEGVGPV